MTTAIEERLNQLQDHSRRYGGGEMTVGQFLQGRSGEAAVDADGETFIRCSFPLAKDYRRFIRNDVSPFQPDFTLISGVFVDQLEYALFDAPVRKLATTERMERGDFDGKVPAVDDTANEASVFEPNQLAPVGTDVTTFSSKSLRPWFYSTGLIAVSRALIEDAPERLAGLPGIVGGRLARGQNRAFTTGINGVGGLIHEAYSPITSASPTAFTVDEALALPAAVPGDYLEGPATGWMMHPNIWLYVKSLKDGNGNYLWKLSGAGDWPIFRNKHMPTIGAGNVPLLFGDFSRFKITDFGAVAVDRFTERRAELYEDAFQGLMLTGSVLADAGTHPVVSLTMHS